MSTHNIPFLIMKKSPKGIPNLQLWDFSKGPKNEFKTAVVNKPSVFELLKFYYKVFSDIFISFFQLTDIDFDEVYLVDL